MSLDPMVFARQKLERAMKEKKETDDKVNALIWGAVLFNAGLGGVPFGINLWSFVGVVTVMVGLIGSLYGHHLSQEGISKLIRQIFTSVGATWAMLTLGMKFFAEVLKGAGIITLGGATVAGMALDAVLSGAVTFALGYTAKEFFRKDQKLSQQEMGRIFKAQFEEGKRQVKTQAFHQEK